MAGARTLITDDDGAMRLLARMLVEEEGCQVVAEAASGEEAIDRVAAIEADLVLMDYRLPGIDGIEATARIRAIRPDIHVVGWSSHADDKVFERFREAGALAGIHKTDVPALRDALRRVAPR